MIWARLKLCMEGFCDPLARASDDRYKFSDLSTGDCTIVAKVIQCDVQTDYIPGDELGHGSFGLVKEGTHRKTFKKVALKFVARQNLSDRDEHLFLAEAGILSGLAHGNILETYGLYKSDIAYCLTLELMAGGELFDDIIRRSFYSEACARRVVLQVLDALAFLHRRGIIHRDVKPENLLLPRVGSEDVKLADFGFATVLAPPTYQAVDPVGTPGYAAPEVLRLLPYDGKVDVFSVGVISFVLLAGYLPFRGDTVREMVIKTLSEKVSFDEARWAAISEDAKDFVKSLLHVSASTRPGADEALSHPWMKAPGETLRSISLDDGSGNTRERLEDFQRRQQASKKKLKAAVGAVLATNRFRKILETVGDKSEREGAKSSEAAQAFVAHTSSSADCAGGAVPDLTPEG